MYWIYFYIHLIFVWYSCYILIIFSLKRKVAWSMHLNAGLCSVAYNVLQQPFQDIHSLSHHLGVIWTKHLKRGCNYQHNSTNMYPKLQTLILNQLTLCEFKRKTNMRATSTEEVSIAAGASRSHWNDNMIITFWKSYKIC